MAPSIFASSDRRCGAVLGIEKEAPGADREDGRVVAHDDQRAVLGLQNSVETLPQRGARGDQRERVVQRLAAAGRPHGHRIRPLCADRLDGQRVGERAHPLDRKAPAAPPPARRPTTPAPGARVKPARQASASRRSAPGTTRTSPARPSSPNTTRSGGTGRSVTTEARARATPRSTAGSVTRCRRRPRRRTRPRPGTTTGPAGQDGQQQVDPGGVDAQRLRGRDTADAAGPEERLHLDEERPPALQHRHHRAAGDAGHAVPEHQRTGVGHGAQPVVAHFEDADLTGRAEAVLHRGEHAQGVVAVTVEGQHRVDQVLDRPRSGQVTVLGDVAHQDERRRRSTWPAGSAGPHTPSPGPGCRPGRAARRRRPSGSSRPPPAPGDGARWPPRWPRRRARARASRCLGTGTDADRPPADLGQRLLGRGQQHVDAGGGHRGQDLEEEGRLADPGRPEDQGDRAATTPPPRRGRPRPRRWARVRPAPRPRPRPAPAPASPPPAPAARRARRAGTAASSVFHSAASGATAHPAQGRSVHARRTEDS